MVGHIWVRHMRQVLLVSWMVLGLCFAQGGWAETAAAKDTAEARPSADEAYLKARKFYGGGDFAQALIALDADVIVAGRHDARTVPFAALHRLPGETPHRETSLAPGEIIAEFVVPARPWTWRSLYLKVRDRQSYEFAVASAAVALDLAGDTVRDVRIALGGVATVPWRAHEAETALRGGALSLDAMQAAARAAFADARPHSHNAFKIALGEATLVRALSEAAMMVPRP